MMLTQVLEWYLSLPRFQVTWLLPSCNSVCTLGFLFYCSNAKNNLPSCVFTQTALGKKAKRMCVLSYNAVVTFTDDVLAAKCSGGPTQFIVMGFILYVLVGRKYTAIGNC